MPRQLEKMAVPVAYLLMVFFGIALVIIASVVQFPVGCNFAGFVCYINPISWWTTYWPNFLTIGAGFLILSISAFRTASSSARSFASSLRLPVGYGLLPSGLVLLLPSIGLGVNSPRTIHFGPINGHPSPGFQDWSVWWPNYVALAISISLVLVGTGLVLVDAGVMAAVRRRIRERRHSSSNGGDGSADASLPSGVVNIIQSSNRGRRYLKLLGFYLCFIFGVVALILGELGAPFPPPLLGQTYYSQVDLRSMLLASPFLLTTGFLLAGSSINSQEAGEEESPKEGRENISNVTRSNR